MPHPIATLCTATHAGIRLKDVGPGLICSSMLCYARRSGEQAASVIEMEIKGNLKSYTAKSFHHAPCHLLYGYVLATKE